VTPIYESLKGWQTPIQHVKHYQDLPQEAKAYLARIETLLGLPIRYISNGPNREQLIERNPYFK
jgi:adenylosuccinate synthase